RLFARRVGVVVQYGEVGGAAVMGYFDADIKVSEADVRLARDGGHTRALWYACRVRLERDVLGGHAVIRCDDEQCRFEQPEVVHVGEDVADADIGLIERVAGTFVVWPVIMRSGIGLTEFVEDKLGNGMLAVAEDLARLGEGAVVDLAHELVSLLVELREPAR